MNGVVGLCDISVPIGLYGFQHYLSMLGSLILIPLVIVPAMGGAYVSHTILTIIYNANTIIYVIFMFYGYYEIYCG